MNRSDFGISEIMLWLHELKIINELLQSCTAIVITVVGSSEESLEVRQSNFSGEDV